jgi:hypothetical protein
VHTEFLLRWTRQETWRQRTNDNDIGVCLCKQNKTDNDNDAPSRASNTEHFITVGNLLICGYS